ncbi:PaaI-thioesterase [Trichophyton violaceum]|uniref:PaaI-thioesterase n=1 Tax=Trichophyton violaceum TaxID=34388 RepID=A0A178FLW0_TRIVO|nr:PaaI-thioesterase [Trichophyton violaceum]
MSDEMLKDDDDDVGLSTPGSLLLDSLRITAARPGTVRFELDVQKEHTNRLGILHGGTIASMVDLGGSLAVASHGLFATGVSTDLNVTYLGSGGKVGDKILAEVTCDKFGNKLAYTTIKFTNKADEIVARGSHTKYIAQAFRDPRNIIEQKKS